MERLRHAAAICDAKHFQRFGFGGGGESKKAEVGLGAAGFGLVKCAPIKAEGVMNSNANA